MIDYNQIIQKNIELRDEKRDLEKDLTRARKRADRAKTDKTYNHYLQVQEDVINDIVSINAELSRNKELFDKE